MRRTFDVLPPDLRKAWSLPAIALTAGMVGIAMAAREDPRAWLLSLPVGLACLAIAWSLQRRSVAIDGHVLRIAAGFSSATISLDALDRASARIVDLQDERGLRPLLRTSGTSLPGFRAGHYRLYDRSRGFLLLTSHRKVLVLRERNGRTILLSLVRPQALLDALDTGASDRRR